MLQVNLEDVLGGFNLGDLFGGGGRKQQRSRRGNDLETEVSISFNDCLDGTPLPPGSPLPLSLNLELDLIPAGILAVIVLVSLTIPVPLQFGSFKEMAIT